MYWCGSQLSRRLLSVVCNHNLVFLVLCWSSCVCKKVSTTLLLQCDFREQPSVVGSSIPFSFWTCFPTPALTAVLECQRCVCALCALWSVWIASQKCNCVGSPPYNAGRAFFAVRATTYLPGTLFGGNIKGIYKAS